MKKSIEKVMEKEIRRRNREDKKHRKMINELKELESQYPDKPEKGAGGI
jgi:hypothetical protein